MSLKTPRSLLTIGAVVVALLAGTILLGNYGKILPAGSGSGAQAEAQNVKACPRKAAAGFDAKSCPLGRTEPCCADECCKACCPAECCPDRCCPDECCPDKCCKACCPAECCPDKCCEDCCPENAEGCCAKETKPCCS